MHCRSIIVWLQSKWESFLELAMMKHSSSEIVWCSAWTELSLVFWSLCIWDMRIWLLSELRLQCCGMWHHVLLGKHVFTIPRVNCICAGSTFHHSVTVPCGVRSQKTAVLLILLLLRECICICKHICSFTVLPAYTFVYWYLFFFFVITVLLEKETY